MSRAVTQLAQHHLDFLLLVYKKRKRKIVLHKYYLLYSTVLSENQCDKRSNTYDSPAKFVTATYIMQRTVTKPVCGFLMKGLID